METGTIMRADVIKQMDNGDVFDIVFITADRRRGTGGQVKTLKGYKKICGHKSEVKTAGDLQKKSALQKDPRHAEHKTVNVYNPTDPSQHTITIHTRAIIFFNHLRII